jgi:hypothetical protein
VCEQHHRNAKYRVAQRLKTPRLEVFRLRGYLAGQRANSEHTPGERQTQDQRAGEHDGTEESANYGCEETHPFGRWRLDQVPLQQ